MACEFNGRELLDIFTETNAVAANTGSWPADRRTAGDHGIRYFDGYYCIIFLTFALTATRDAKPEWMMDDTSARKATQEFDGGHWQDHYLRNQVHYHCCHHCHFHSSPFSRSLRFSSLAARDTNSAEPSGVMAAMPYY